MVAAMGESDEFKEIYKEFEETARSEGYEEIADFFKELREVEESHNERYMDFYDKVKSKVYIHQKNLWNGYVQTVDISMKEKKHQWIVLYVDSLKDTLDF